MDAIELKLYPHPTLVSTLPSGLTLITMRTPSKRVRIREVVKAGSRCDAENQGIAHFWEHLAYQGEQRQPIHPSMYPLAIKGVRWHAGTSYSFVRFDARGLNKYFPDMLTTLHRRVFGFGTTEQAVREEIEVIQQETKERELEFRYQNWLMKLMYPNYPEMHHTPAGSMESIAAITRDKLMAFHRSWFHGKNTAIIVVGNIDHEQAATLVTGQMTPTGGNENLLDTNPVFPVFRQGVYRCNDRPSELLLYFPRPTDERDDALIGCVLDMLTDGMLSILIQRLRIRERKIYAASGYPWPDVPLHCLALDIYLQPHLFTGVEEKVMEEIKRLAQGDFPDDTLNWQKAVAEEYYLTCKDEMDGGDWLDELQDAWLEDTLFSKIATSRIIATATREDIARVTRQYMLKEHGCIQIIMEEE